MLYPQPYARQNGWDTAALLRGALTQRQDSYTGFWVGEAAYSDWLHDVRRTRSIRISPCESGWPRPGAGRMGRYDFGREIRRTGSYEAEDFYRIPSHDILLYQGKSLLCATVFANQVHVLDAESMTLHRKISFSKKRRVPDFIHGPYPVSRLRPHAVHPASDGWKSLSYFGQLVGNSYFEC